MRAIEQMEKLAHDNARLRLRAKNLQLDCVILQVSIDTLELSASNKRDLIVHIRNHFNTSLARACRLLHISRTLYHYSPSG